MKQQLRLLLFLAITAVLTGLFGFLIEYYAQKAPDLKDYAKELEKELAKTEAEIEIIFNNASFLMGAIGYEIERDSIAKYEEKPYTLLIYTDSDSLVYWSNNKLFPYRSEAQYSEESIQKLYESAGSQYLMIKKPYDFIINKKRYNFTLMAFVPIYLHFPVQNAYLRNNYPLMPPEFSHYVEPSQEASSEYEVLDSKGNRIAQIQAKSKIPLRPFIAWAFLLYGLSALFLILFIYLFTQSISQKGKTVLAFLIFAGLIVIIRLATLYLDLPKSIHQVELFNLFFSSPNALWRYSLGDFLVDVVLFAWIALFLHREWRTSLFARWTPIQQWSFTIAQYIVLTAGISFIQSILRDVSLSPNVYFEFEDFSKIDYFSILALLSVVLLFFTFFLVCNKMYRISKSFDLNLTTHVSILTTVLLATALVQIIWGGILSNILYATFFSALFAVLLHFFSKQQKLSFIWISGWLFFFAITATSMLEKANVEKDLKMRKDFLKQVAAERDIALEDAFIDLEKQIQNDEFFKLYFASLYIPYKEVIDRLTYLYLNNSFFGKYRYEFHLYTPQGNPKKEEKRSFADIKLQLQNSQRIHGSNLYFYSIPKGTYSYVAHLPIIKNGNVLGIITIELYPQPTSDESSIYVELLSMPSGRIEKVQSSYNFALYKYNQRVAARGGNLPAFISFNAVLPNQEAFQVLKDSDENKEYLMYRDKRDYLSVVELSEESFLKPLSIFSYLFCSGIVSVFFAAFFNWLLFFLFRIKMLSFSFQESLRERIQRGIVIVSLLSFVAIGVITIIYFRYEYTDYHRSRLERKIGSTAKTAMWQILHGNDSIATIPNAKELANIHKIDVNVYDLNGSLLSTSEDAVFERRLISREMHPVAYFKMRYERINNLIQSEKIDNFKYLAAYVPLKDKRGEIIAFLNLPYDLAGSSNIRSQDVAEFLGALLNVYVIFLLLAGIVALIIANSVTQPLSAIGEKFRQIRVGVKNEPLIWNSEDEIGTLVNRYNDMIKQLEESTEQLARTQRETAWREMAKQVAHEIKNPLTPMKLNVQLLQRVSGLDPQKAEKMIQRVTNALIEQIDNLAHIASEFSNFAKMPVANNEIFLLNRVVESVYDLFREEENIQFRANIVEKDLWVFADKNQIIRVLNNLVKNAIQAIPNDRPGIIQLYLYTEMGNAVVKVSDNGVGIPEDRKNDIFVPYFTTKTSGTGIGLAMSKNIIELAKGKIHFESKEGIGSDFYIELPLHSPPEEKLEA